MLLVYYRWLCKRFKIAAALVIAENKWTPQQSNLRYWKLNVPKLKNELVVRGAVSTGRKADLIHMYLFFQYNNRQSFLKLSVVWQAGLLHIIIVVLSGLWLSEIGRHFNSSLLYINLSLRIELKNHHEHSTEYTTYVIISSCYHYVFRSFYTKCKTQQIFYGSHVYVAFINIPCCT